MFDSSRLRGGANAAESAALVGTPCTSVRPGVREGEPSSDSRRVERPALCEGHVVVPPLCWGRRQAAAAHVWGAHQAGAPDQPAAACGARHEERPGGGARLVGRHEEVRALGTTRPVAGWPRDRASCVCAPPRAVHSTDTKLPLPFCVLRAPPAARFPDPKPAKITFPEVRTHAHACRLCLRMYPRRSTCLNPAWTRHLVPLRTS